MKERLILEEKQRKQMENELCKLKKNLKESENVVEVTLQMNLSHLYFHVHCLAK